MKHDEPSQIFVDAENKPICAKKMYLMHVELMYRYSNSVSKMVLLEIFFPNFNMWEDYGTLNISVDKH